MISLNIMHSKLLFKNNIIVFNTFLNYSLFISMDGVYAENRRERFQYIIHFSLSSYYLTANNEPSTLLKYT